jgi:superoxide dismutase
MQQWKAYLLTEFVTYGLDYSETNNSEDFDIKTNSLRYFSWLRTVVKSLNEMDESRDDVAWVVLERQLRELAKKAEKGSANLASKMHFNERKIQVVLNFSYDDEQHIVYVS